MVKVSVIIPNFNHAPFLVERIDSILNQTFQDFEILILDDASTDSSLEVLNAYKQHPKVTHFIVNEINSGSPFKQWRKGIELAKGNYIWIAETDDFADITFLEQTLKLYENHPSSALVYTDARIVNENGEFLGLWSEGKNNFFNTDRWSRNYVSTGKDEVNNYLLYKVTINNVSSVLFKKDHLSDVKFLNDLIMFKSTGDLFTYLYMSLKGSISYCNHPLNNYRAHLKNVTKSNMRNGLIYKERLKCYNQMLPLLIQYGFIDLQSSSKEKPFKFILKKNVFQAMNFNYYKELKNFVSLLGYYDIFNKTKVKSFLLLFKLYKVDLLISKKLSRRLIKFFVKT